MVNVRRAWERVALRFSAFLLVGLITWTVAVAWALDTPEMEKLEPSDGMSNMFFGQSVSVSQNTVVVGAPYADKSTVSAYLDDAGLAYVYVLSGGAWTQQAKLTASDAAEFDLFGWAVAISGDTIVVGARTLLDYGSAYVYTRSDNAWTQQAKLTASDAASFYFGASVAIWGDTVVVGVPDKAMFGSPGAAYVFRYSDGAWSQEAKLTAADAEDGDQFGISVAISGETVVVGADDEDGDSISEGAAYVFTRSGSTWSQQAKLTAPVAYSFEYTGQSVSLSGDTAILGSKAFGESAYVFTRSASVWALQATLVADDGGSEYDDDWYRVAVSGDTALLGSPNEGQAYLFARSGSVWTQQLAFNPSGAWSGSDFGLSVALSDSMAVIGSGSNQSYAPTGCAYVLVEDATGFSNMQTCHVVSDGQFYAAIYNMSTGSVCDTVDANYSATMTYTKATNTWFGAYVYDYATAAWVRALHTFQQNL